MNRADVQTRFGLIASVIPFVSWPVEVVDRLARATRVCAYPRGAIVMARGDAVDSLVLVADGAVHASATSRSGRRHTFAIDEHGRVYGLIALLDGGIMTNDVIAAEPCTVLAIPFEAIREELARDARLWESLALELARRSRGQIALITRKLLDAPRAQLAHHLASLASASGEVKDGAIVIRPRLTHERLGEMLGVSRQTATALVRELAAEGVIQWRYGRALVIDLERLRRIAEEGATI